MNVSEATCSRIALSTSDATWFTLADIRAKIALFKALYEYKNVACYVYGEFVTDTYDVVYAHDTALVLVSVGRRFLTVRSQKTGKDYRVTPSENGNRFKLCIQSAEH